MSIETFVNQIISDGVLTREEHDMFIEMVYADGEVDEAESAQIARIFSLIREGKLVVIDDESQRKTVNS